MDADGYDDHIERFVHELLHTGCVLTEIAATLIEDLPADAYPGEKPETVVVEMMCGTIATALASANPRDVQRATELIDLAAARTLEHLQLALHLSRRIRGDVGGDGPTYG